MWSPKGVCASGGTSSNKMQRGSDTPANWPSVAQTCHVAPEVEVLLLRCARRISPLPLHQQTRLAALEEELKDAATAEALADDRRAEVVLAASFIYEAIGKFVPHAAPEGAWWASHRNFLAGDASNAEVEAAHELQPVADVMAFIASKEAGEYYTNSEGAASVAEAAVLHASTKLV